MRILRLRVGQILISIAVLLAICVLFYTFWPDGNIGQRLFISRLVGWVIYLPLYVSEDVAWFPQAITITVLIGLVGFLLAYYKNSAGEGIDWNQSPKF
jgi:hypothetical protein